METGNCIREEEVFEIASFKSMNEITGKVIEVTLYPEKDQLGAQVVTISMGNKILAITSLDLPGLILSLESVMGNMEI